MFQPPKAVCTPNQLASLAMSESQARHDRVAADDPLAALRSGSGYATILGVLVAAGGVVMSLIASDFASPVLMTLLATLAMLGVFFLFGMAAGHIRIGERLPEAELVKAMTDADDVGIMVTRRRNGEPIYANAAFSHLIGRSQTGTLGSIENAFSGVSEASEAIFRLSRASAAGESHSEDIPAGPRSGAEGEDRRVLRISVHPFTSPATEQDPGPLTVWTYKDVTDELRAAEAQRTRFDEDLRLYDRMPAGIMAIDGDGIVTHANTTFLEWIGYGEEVVRGRLLRLTDLVSSDGAEVLMRAARDRAQSLAIDLDLAREDGRVVPMHLACSAAGTNGDKAGLVIGCFNRENTAVEDADGGDAELRFTRFFQSAPFGIATVAADGTITSANAAFQRMILDGTIRDGQSEQALELLTRHSDGAMRTAVEAGLADVLAGRASVAPIDITVGQNKDFTRRVFMSPIAGATGSGVAAVLYVIDATEQRRLEARVAQSNKMEAVGTLAGGIAHDFNNVLTAIIGFSEFLLQAHRPGDPAHRDLLQIKSAASRAAGLVSKLLAFSRKQTLNNEVMQLGELMSDLTPMLKRTLGETIELKLSTERELWLVKTDKTQIDRVIVNLAINARDAMADGGTLTVRTRNVTERECQKMDHFGLAVGEYVLIEIEDTGCGMSPEVMNKIFEPFFTTKGVGKGTGLGLATVYGIVKQSGGFIFPESEVGKGTTFRVFLPRYLPETDEEAQLAQKANRSKEAKHAPDVTGSGRVLLVEDEDGVRSFAVRALRSRGFEVLEASNGAEALDLLEADDNNVDIVVSDVVMPEMDGPTLLKKLRETAPDIKFVFMSGYPNDAFRAGLDERETFGFLPKPFTLSELVIKVKEELAD